MAIVVDTDVVSYIFKKDSRAALYEPHMVQIPKFISFMTFAELRRWEFQSNWGRGKTAKFELLLSDFGVIYADEKLCNIWASITNESKKKGRPVSTADAWIAATALMFEIPLVTNNRKDFDQIDGLSILS
jgi:predicted nucleic acid-binding protein